MSFSFFSMLVVPLSSFALYVIGSLGYLGVFLLMVLESMIFPVPSELVMPFAGFLIHQGSFTWLGVIFASTLGSLVGSMISYWIGFHYGSPFIEKYGKYFLVNTHHLHQTQNWFSKQGEKFIFISRFIPVVRHLVSLVAGTAQMNLKKFLLFTALGALGWNFILTYLGFQLGEHYDQVKQSSEPLTILVLFLLVAAVVWWFFRAKKSK